MRVNQREEVGELRAHRQGWGLCPCSLTPAQGGLPTQGSLDTPKYSLAALQSTSLLLGPPGWVTPLPVRTIPFRPGLSWLLVLHRRKAVSKPCSL